MEEEVKKYVLKQDVGTWKKGKEFHTHMAPVFSPNSCWPHIEYGVNILIALGMAEEVKEIPCEECDAKGYKNISD